MLAARERRLEKIKPLVLYVRNNPRIPPKFKDHKPLVQFRGMLLNSNETRIDQLLKRNASFLY